MPESETLKGSASGISGIDTKGNRTLVGGVRRRGWGTIVTFSIRDRMNMFILKRGEKRMPGKTHTHTHTLVCVCVSL